MESSEGTLNRHGIYKVGGCLMMYSFNEDEWQCQLCGKTMRDNEIQVNGQEIKNVVR